LFAVKGMIMLLEGLALAVGARWSHLDWHPHDTAACIRAQQLVGDSEGGRDKMAQ
jgi:hypothetical protein